MSDTDDELGPPPSLVRGIGVNEDPNRYRQNNQDMDDDQVGGRRRRKSRRSRRSSRSSSRRSKRRRRKSRRSRRTRRHRH